MNHVMIDIETLGRAPNGAIAQIAAVRFDPFSGETGSTFSMNVDAVTSQKAGMKIDAETALWWMQQSEGARNEVFGIPEAESLKPWPLSSALIALGGFFIDVPHEDVIVWANGAQFDLVILKSAFELTSKAVPWKWSNERDARTIYKLFPEIKKEHEFTGTKHDALADCLNQVAILHKCYQKIFNH